MCYNVRRAMCLHWKDCSICPWGRAVLQAGKNPLTIDEILRLHIVLIEDTRFTRVGLRLDGVFLGDRDHDGDPLPEFIGARPEDLQPLMQGMIAANERMSEGELDSVLQAAATAFGFVYIHPFQDGNGRLQNSHRPAWYSPFLRSCSTGSTPTATRCALIRDP
jgi:hypothetical protein